MIRQSDRVATLDWLFREGLSKEAICKLRSECQTKYVGGGLGGSVFQEEEMSGPNSLKQKQTWPAPWTGRKSLWLNIIKKNVKWKQHKMVRKVVEVQIMYHLAASIRSPDFILILMERQWNNLNRTGICLDLSFKRITLDAVLRMDNGSGEHVGKK